MAHDVPDDVARLLDSLRANETRDSMGGGNEPGLIEDAYDDLRRLAGFLMAGEPPGHTLQATALVNEAYVKLVGGRAVDWQDRRHFINTAARAMRQVLLDRARRYATRKHGAGHGRVDLSDLEQGTADTVPLDRFADLDEAMRTLENAHPRAAEVVQLRFVVGLSVPQTAEAMEIAEATVKKDWKFARAWLLRQLARAGAGHTI